MHDKSIFGVVIEESQSITIEELCQLTHCKKEIIYQLIEYQLIAPKGGSPKEWRFDSSALKRTRIASSFYYDLEINFQGIALALELMEKIETLEHQVKLFKKMTQE